MIRVVLPTHLRSLAKVGGEVVVQVSGPVNQGSVLDAIEVQYPMLRGTIRDQNTHLRREYIRFFACGQDLSHDAPDEPLPDEVVSGKDRFIVVGAMAGG
jgi:sulfur-carrier protein